MSSSEEVDPNHFIYVVEALDRGAKPGPLLGELTAQAEVLGQLSVTVPVALARDLLSAVGEPLRPLSLEKYPAELVALDAKKYDFG